MKVALFPGCMIDMFYPEVGLAAVRVLERLGCEVQLLPEKQVCCGQGLLNSGYKAKATHVARYLLDAYDDGTTYPIVSFSGSCMNAIVNDFPTLVFADTVYKEKLARVSGRFYEFCDFIVNYLGVSDVGAQFSHRVTYHASCHLTRLLGILEPPLELLGAVEGLEYIELAHKDRCCGFGGTFSFKEPEISSEIVREKCQTVIDSGAEVLCGADMPCLMNIEGALSRMKSEGECGRDIRVMHIAQILDARE